MTSPIRPPIFPPAQTVQPPRADAARQAAQKAFFDMATGKAAAPAHAPPVATVVAAPAAPRPVQRLPDPLAEAPTKVLRPGSLLDIRV